MNRSLGKVLLKDVNQGVILDNIITLKSNKNIGLLGYQKGENINTYPEYVRQKTQDLLIHLRQLADYIIIDCSSNINQNITITALEQVDRLVSLTTANLKGLSYYNSLNYLIREDNLKIVTMAKEFNSKETINDILKAKNIYLDYTEEIEKQFAEGQILKELSEKKSGQYKKEIKRIIKEILHG